MSYINISPMIRVRDYPRAKAFYMDMLGFDEVVSEAGEPLPGFGVFRGGGAQVMLQAWDEPNAQPDTTQAYVFVEDMDAFVTRLQDKGHPFEGPTVRWYGLKEVELSDPDGNILCFGRGAE